MSRIIVSRISFGHLSPRETKSCCVSFLVCCESLEVNARKSSEIVFSSTQKSEFVLNWLPLEDVEFVDSVEFNVPTAQNLGNIGNLSYPTGIFSINDNGNWRVFVVNAGDRTRTGGVFSLTRLDFGSSLLNTPIGLNLGNPGNMLQHPRDLTIMKSCN